MKKYWVFSIFVIACLALKAQNIQIQTPPGYNYIYEEKDLPKGIEGSPYLNEWEEATVVFKNGKSISNLKMRFNVRANQMMYQYDNKTYIIGAPDSIKEINFPSHKFVYQNILKGNKVEKAFVEPIATGKASLLNKYEIEIIRSNYNVALDIGNKNDRMVLKQYLYLSKDDKALLVKKKSQLFEVLNDKKNDLESYIKKENLSVKDKDDMVKIVKYYNQLP